MGLLRYLHGDDILTRQTGESRSLPPAENELPLLSAYTATPISPTAALAIADVLSAVRVLADAASSLPLHVYRKAESGRERVDSGKLVDLLDRPGPATTQADLVSSLMTHLRGERRRDEHEHRPPRGTCGIRTERTTAAARVMP
jgi:phage portal protein BeeE